MRVVMLSNSEVRISNAFDSPVSYKGQPSIYVFSCFKSLIPGAMYH
jgi:hypothetical protein